MKVFLSGTQKAEFILETLEDLDEHFGISSICGSAYSPCMDFILPWAEADEIPVTLYFPMTTDINDLVCMNIEIINKERPQIVMIYDEEDLICETIITEAVHCDSTVLRKIA